MSANINLAEMARLTGRSSAALSKVETGEQPYKQDVLEDYARVLQCAPGDLIDRQPAEVGKMERAIARVRDKRLALALLNAVAEREAARAPGDLNETEAN